MRHVEYRCRRCGSQTFTPFIHDKHLCGDGGRGIVDEVGLGPDDRDNVRVWRGPVTTVAPDPGYTFSLATEQDEEKK